MTSKNGFIVLPRKVFNDLSFEGEKFSRREAFIDLVQLASFEPADIPSRCGTIHLEVGELICSVRTLAVRWGWSIGKVSSVLKEFENEHKLIRKIEHSMCIISICSYALFVGTKDCSLNANLNNIKQENTSSSTNVDSEDILKQEEKEKVTKVTQKKNEDSVNRIYSIYPTKCPISGRSLGKCSKDKTKIASLLKTRTAEDIELTIREYIVDCKNHNTFLKNFGTLLNNLPEREEPKNQAPVPAQMPPPQPEKRSPEMMAIDAMHQGVTDANVVRQGILMVWGDEVTEDRIQQALYNTGYRQ